jgi:MBOAT, membrane-bound O-acyltransferase family
MITLTQYINHRLGVTPQEQAVNFLAKPFGARSFTEFWQYWNPVWGYYLFYYCYHPLHKKLPRSLSVFLTFLICGFIHDLPFAIAAYVTNGKLPFFTITTFFILIGSLVVITEKVKFQFTSVPIRLRWLIHITFLLLCYQAALYLTAR